MMFLGPKAASPPKKTPGRVDCNVFSSTTGISHLSNSMPRSRSIQGNAFSWPMARMTSSAGRKTVSIVCDAWRFGVPFEALEFHALELAVFDHEALRRVIDDDLDAFFLGILEFPGGRFEESARAARHHLDVFAAEPAGRPAAIHGGVADADDQDPLADRIDMAEGNRFEPIDADVDPIGIVAAGNFEIFAARRTAAHEDGVEPLVEQCLHAFDGRIVSGYRRPYPG